MNETNEHNPDGLTPKTDALFADIFGPERDWTPNQKKTAKLARDLEQELAESNAIINLQHKAIKTGEQRGLAKAEEAQSARIAELENEVEALNGKLTAAILGSQAEVERLTKERDRAQADFDSIVRKGCNGWYDDQCKHIATLTRERDEAKVRIGSPSGPTLEKYLKQNMSFGTIDFAIRSSLDGQNGNALLYIHPSGRDGDTLDFRVEGNSLYPL